MIEVTAELRIATFQNLWASLPEEVRKVMYREDGTVCGCPGGFENQPLADAVRTEYFYVLQTLLTTAPQAARPRLMLHPYRPMGSGQSKVFEAYWAVLDIQSNGDAVRIYNGGLVLHDPYKPNVQIHT